MNTRLLTLAPSHATRLSRAQFSPLVRRLPARAVGGAQPAPRTAGIGPVASPSGDPLGFRIWTPGLLDRLQAPLTRHRE